MKKFVQRLALAILMCVIGTSVSKAIGWPANYQGVMLQGFYWDSYNDSKWTKLESQADELSKYFSLIWVPNSGKASGNPNMGYMPIYWFTNHNSSFGTEAELRSMIKTFKAKGTGIIADVVINHRVGVNNWADFPTETWNGKTYSMGASDVCRTDEWGQGTGNNDTGDDFGAARDLDHTSANVQNCCKDYCKFLLTDLGYAGFRYDMVKGYSGQYTKMYNTASNATFSVGEYWDGSYDAVKAWIDATGKTSAAFDFPFKYAVNDAFSSNDMTKLVWKANGTTPQPAGMIHFGYTQYAVTFIDNHDTYRDNNKFNGNVVAANAFMLMSPGTPCVFLPHYTANKQAIQRLIDVRNSVGLHNNSAVNVLKSTNNCYMAEVTGTKGKLVVKIGSAMDAPSGYTSSDIVATGNGYCVWTKVAIQGGGHVDPNPDPVTAPDNLYIMGNLKQGSWKTNVGVKMTKDGSKFTAKNVELVLASAAETKAFFTLTTALGTTGENTEWDEVINASDRYGAASKDLTLTPGTAADVTLFAEGVNASSAYSWGIDAGSYDVTVDFETMKITAVKAGTNPDPDPDPDPVTTPDNLYIMGNLKQGSWKTNVGVKMTKDGSKFTAKNVELVLASAAETKAFFTLTTALGATGENTEWDEVINASDRYGAASKDLTLTPGTAADVNLFAEGVNASSAYSWGIDAGSYDITVDFKTMKITAVKTGSNPDPDPDPDPVTTPDNLYVIGNIPGAHWNTNGSIAMTKDRHLMVAKVTLECINASETHAFFSLVTKQGASWDDVNGGDRFGAESKDQLISEDTPAKMVKFPVNVSASSANSWKVAPGTYYIAADFKNNTVTVSKNPISGVEVIETEYQDVAPVYYNLQGVRVENPTNGLYIVVRGNKVSKVLIH